uniref:Vegetative storage protein 2 n=1 Tax=Sesuvium portulacastrum TaxID=221166 RepID=A0A2I7ZAT0_SESPO|nr:vegetative storage protein 2 [Sesuvium portulacastrum]
MKSLPLLLIFLLSCLLFSISFSSPPEESVSSHSHVLPRPLIIEYPDGVGEKENYNDDQRELLQLECTSWRFAVESNNLRPWKKIPLECADYVKDYVTGRAYKMDLDRVSNEASFFARSVQIGDDGNDVWVFDVDETLISHLPYYAQHGYGLEEFDSVAFDEWVDKAMAPSIEPSLRLYEEVMSLGFKVFLLTGRSEKQRDVTVQNLLNVGFKNWDKLILRGAEDHGKLATVYKSEKRIEMVKDGYRILGNSGDQWSDLLGSAMSTRSFKLPNPMYYIP